MKTPLTITREGAEYVHAESVSKELGGHRRSQLFGDTGLIAATMRCVYGYENMQSALAELVAATREKWRDENGSLRQYKAITAAEKLLKK